MESQNGDHCSSLSLAQIELFSACETKVLEQALQEEQDVPLLSALLQLKQLQQINSWNSRCLWSSWCLCTTVLLEEALMLLTLMEEELISEYMLVFIPDSTSDLQGSKQLTQAVRWLLARSPPPLPLSCQTLVQLMEASLSQEFWPRVFSNLQNRAAARLPWQEAAPVVRLYNAVLAHVAHRVSSQDLCGLSWPPAEFSQPETRALVPHLGWNSAQHLSWLRGVILSLLLPEWEETPAADCWPDLCSSIFGYAAKIPASRHSQPLLMSRLENLLERVRLQAQHPRPPRSSPADGNTDLEEPGVQIPWEDVLLIFIDHKLKDWQPPGPPACGERLRLPARRLLLRLPDRGCSRARWRPPGPRGPVWTSLTAPQQRSCWPTRSCRAWRKNRLRARGRDQSLEQLRRWLDGDPLDHLSTPLFMPSSTLLSSPTTMKVAPSGRTEDAAAATQRPELDQRVDGPSWSKAPPVPLARRLQDLERQILASREEELACRLKLSGLLSIVDD
ncbi:germinal-center associated nuclear protein-like [Fundulus diaphanus]